MSRLNRQKIDQLGIITSGLCAIHCAAIPILLSLGLLGGINSFQHGTFEIFVIALSTILGSWSIYNAFHVSGKIIPQLLIGIGALIIILGICHIFFGHAMMAVGGCLLLLGHSLNWRQLARSRIGAR